MSDRFARVFLLAACAAIPFTFWAVLSMPVASGSLYPEFSSFRSDQRGTLLLYEALAGTGKFETTRNFTRLSQTSLKNASVLMIGVALTNDLQDLWKAADQVASAGNRVLVALQPIRAQDPSALKAPAAVLEKRGVRVTWIEQKPGAHNWVPILQPDSSWHILRGSKTSATAIERPAGTGAVVLASDPEPFTNESLAKQPDSALLVDLLGNPRRIVFDESHLGIVETGTVMGLARHYRLQGFLIGILAVAMLFLWRASNPFPPPRPRKPVGETPDPITGFASLLERSLPKTQLIAECMKARAQTDRAFGQRGGLADTAAQQTQRAPDEIFRQIQADLHNRKQANTA